MMTSARSGVAVTASSSIDATNKGDGVSFYVPQGRKTIYLAVMSSCSSAEWFCHCPAWRFIALLSVERHCLASRAFASTPLPSITHHCLDAIA